MKKFLVLSLLLSVFIISCEKEMKWINPYDPNADQTEFERICKKSGFECGDIIATYQGASFEINCGECSDGYTCIDNLCERTDSDDDDKTDAVSDKDDDKTDTVSAIVAQENWTEVKVKD